MLYGWLSLATLTMIQYWYRVKCTEVLWRDDRCTYSLDEYIGHSTLANASIHVAEINYCMNEVTSSCWLYTAAY